MIIDPGLGCESLIGLTGHISMAVRSLKLLGGGQKGTLLLMMIWH